MSTQPAALSSRTRTPLPPFRWRDLRGVLARELLHARDLAIAAGLSEDYTQRCLGGQKIPAELARARLAAGLRTLRLPDAVQFCGLPPELDAPTRRGSVRRAS